MVDLKSQLKPSHPETGKLGASVSPTDSKELPEDKEKPKESQQTKERIFHCSAPNMRFGYPSKDSFYDKKAAFKNHFLITKDVEIIDFLKANFIDKTSYFVIKEVNADFLNKATTLPAVPVKIEPLPFDPKEAPGT